MRVKKIKQTFVSSSPEETKQFAEQFATTLSKGSVVAFFGDLAAGKTTFIKSLASRLCNISEHDISSPTFVYLHIYPLNDVYLYHFDLYRLQDESQFLSMGFDEYLVSDSICLIEWSERIETLLPKKTIKVYLHHEGETKRLIEIE
jgi:tRNA threonylcarbamoyladenosine biosynthesis protein TsaE